MEEIWEKYSQPNRYKVNIYEFSCNRAKVINRKYFYYFNEVEDFVRNFNRSAYVMRTKEIHLLAGFAEN